MDTYYPTPEEAIAAAKLAVGDDLIEFGGMNCDECVGWDGVSHRCDCGNRRVYWETEQEREGYYAYAQAY